MATPDRFVASARVVAGLTLVSRAAGLVREVVFSRYFGTGELLSAFRIAFMAPNLARRLFGEGALSAAMIPALTQRLQHEGEESSRRFVGSLLVLLIAVLGAGVLLVEVAIVVWRRFTDDPAVALTAITIPYMPLICTVAVIGGVLNVRGHFAAPASAPIFLNLCLIGGTIGAAVWANLRGMALMQVVCLSVLVAGVLQLMLVTFTLWRVGFFPIVGGSFRGARLGAFARTVGPMALGLSAVQINSLMDYVVAYFFIWEGTQRVGPAVLGYAQYLYQFPLGILGVGFATAIFPVLSARAAEGDRSGLASAFGNGVRLSLFAALPASVGLMFVARPLVATLYEGGQFDARATDRVAGTLIFYSLGLSAYFLHHMVVRAFYAVRDNKTPARIALYMVCLNLGLNLSLVSVLQERGLALATALCAVIQVTWLLTKLDRVLPGVAWASIAVGVGKSLVATAIMAAALTALKSFKFHDLTYVIVLVMTGMLTYALAGKLLRIEELKWVYRRGPLPDGHASSAPTHVN